jgi:hypothetical protein
MISTVKPFRRSGLPLQCWPRYATSTKVLPSPVDSRPDHTAVSSQRFTQVDAFTDRPFAGNPAAVCLLPSPRDSTWMQQVAQEMNLAETAFLVRRADGFDLRWFHAALEVDLCGHATLASAHTRTAPSVRSGQPAWVRRSWSDIRPRRGAAPCGCVSRATGLTSAVTR